LLPTGANTYIPMILPTTKSATANVERSGFDIETGYRINTGTVAVRPFVSFGSYTTGLNTLLIKEKINTAALMASMMAGGANGMNILTATFIGPRIPPQGPIPKNSENRIKAGISIQI
jgi:hypothetical protein